MSDQPSIPIIPVTADSLETTRKQFTVAQNDWLQSIDFKPEPGNHALLPNADGKLSAVLVAVNVDAPLQVLAGLPSQLPAGSYHLHCEHDDDWQRQAMLGWQLGGYRFQRYLDNDKPLPELVLPEAWRDGVMRASAATALVRDLINTPTEDMGPEQLELATRLLADEYGAVFGAVSGSDLETHYPAIHVVGRASHRAPRLLRLSWGDKKHPKVALVGKGVCFDTGGLNIKGGSGMLKMKKDMGGAAHALGLARMIMDARLPIRLEVYIPAVENAIAGNAYRPGDVIRTRKGLSIEITNTDAEGRIVLADALTLACEHEPELIIDFATLTGAARIALGSDLPALFSNDIELAEEIHGHGDELEDPLWPMPLYQPYLRMLKSNIASHVNSASSGFAGCITAALFLQQFVDQDISWCHFDTYGWNDGERPGRPAGGEAMGMRASFAMLAQRYA